MEPIFSSVALRDRQREVKDAARKNVVHITENGNGAFVFCSEEIFEERLRRAAEEAIYAERMAQAIREGQDDLATGRTYSISEAFSAIDERRGARG